ncbi:hypothetical protein GCM10009000_034320 [Halobacterium noricense]
MVSRECLTNPREVSRFGTETVHTLLGFPDYPAERAAGDAEANAASPFEIDMWTLHSGATYALTHFFQGKEGASLDQYVRIANDILFNPEGTIERVEQAYEQELAADGDDGSQASRPASERWRASSASATTCRRKSSSSKNARTHCVSGSKRRWSDAASVT